VPLPLPVTQRLGDVIVPCGRCCGLPWPRRRMEHHITSYNTDNLSKWYRIDIGHRIYFVFLVDSFDSFRLTESHRSPIFGYIYNIFLATWGHKQTLWHSIWLATTLGPRKPSGKLPLQWKVVSLMGTAVFHCQLGLPEENYFGEMRPVSFLCYLCGEHRFLLSFVLAASWDFWPGPETFGKQNAAALQAKIGKT